MWSNNTNRWNNNINAKHQHQRKTTKQKQHEKSNKLKEHKESRRKELMFFL
jgi:hypothetical protein